MDKKNNENQSFNNQSNWIEIEYCYSMVIYEDPKFGVYWTVYYNDGWGGSRPSGSLEQARLEAEDMEATCW